MAAPRRRWPSLTLAAAAIGVLGYVLGLRHGLDVYPPEAAVSGQRPVTPEASDAAPAGAMIAAHASDDPWRRIVNQPRTLRTEQEMAAMLAEMAARDPDRAMALAEAEPNWRIRAELRNAVLRGWAKVAPDAACAAGLALREADRPAALGAVFAGAAGNPDALIRIGGHASDADPSRAAEYGQAVIAALANEGAFPVAVRFVLARPASPLRAEQIESTFQTWAEHQPERATSALADVADQVLHDAAFHGAILGWSEADPVALANYAVQLPSGELRAQALANAIPRWVEHDSLAAASWLGQHDPQPDFDMGVVAVATLPNMVSQRPDVAMSLAQTITDGPLRTNTLHNVALKWAETDAAAARRYVETSTNFSPDERKMILTEMGVQPAG